jgi:sulfotransferase family protein
MFKVLDRTPDFLIIGAQKAGTSALHWYLRQHPEIKSARRKEVGFFHQDKVYQRGPRWYARKFSLRFPAKTLLFEADPEYLYHPCAIERIFRFKPTMRLLILLRNPIERAFSAWNMWKQIHEQGNGFVAAILREYLEEANPQAKHGLLEFVNRPVFPDFHDAVLREMDWCLGQDEQVPLEPSFVRRGHYFAQMKRVLDCFPRENTLILEDKELKLQRVETLNRVIRFLNVAEFDWRQAEINDQHVRPYRQRMKEETRRILVDHFKPHNEQLYCLLNRRFNWC